MDLNNESTPCATKQRKEGIIVPECPPHNEVELTGNTPAADFMIMTRANRGGDAGFGKDTYDLIFGDGI